ncbi:MAG TPA: 4-hydroxyphenylacetate 3-hydroxylase, partial [Thermoplasmata archaeon]|nr:4-hydroxyphenylacetate 3-hydroxylase [Thermoplasmata archaeon]
MRTPEDYKESLRGMRPNVYKFGNLIEDVTTHPATRRMVEGHARIYEIALDDRYRDLATTESALTGERVSRYLSLITGPQDMIANSRLKRLMFNLTGTCTGGRCVGWNALNALWAITYEIDAGHGTDYHDRLRRWLGDAQRHDIAVSGALTDPKGNRKLGPSQQADPDAYLHIVERRSDGIVVRGAKVMIAGVSASNEVFVLPTGSYGEDDADYSVAFVTPRDAEGITVIEARHPSDSRDLEEGEDSPVRGGGITQGYVLFDDVFVPEERVFMAGEWQYTGRLIMSFIGPYRSAIGGCVAGQGDLMIGAAVMMSRAHGLGERAIRDKIVAMATNNETTFGMGVAAGVLGRPHPSGVWQPDRLLANVNKVHVATLPYETKRLTQEVAGGIGETGCMPSWTDLTDPEYGDNLRRYLTTEVPGEERYRLARFIEWLTIGGGVPGTMHGGGSPDGARMLIGRSLDIDRLV